MNKKLMFCIIESYDKPKLKEIFLKISFLSDKKQEEMLMLIKRALEKEE